VIEAKYWIARYRRNGYLARSELEPRIDPCYQLENYLAKLRNFHAASKEFEFVRVVYAQGFAYSD